MSFSIAFTQPTFNRSLVLLIGAILAKGPRTITNLLWNVGDLAEGDPTDYHRVFSRAPWSLWKLGRVLAIAVIELAGRDDWIRVVVDCTVAEHKGKKLKTPAAVVASSRLRKTTVSWYGATERQVQA